MVVSLLLMGMVMAVLSAEIRNKDSEEAKKTAFLKHMDALKSLMNKQGPQTCGGDFLCNANLGICKESCDASEVEKGKCGDGNCSCCELPPFF